MKHLNKYGRQGAKDDSEIMSLAGLWDLLTDTISRCYFYYKAVFEPLIKTNSGYRALMRKLFDSASS